MPRALISCLHLQRGFEAVRPRYQAHGIEAILPDVAGQQFGAEEMRELIGGVDAVIAGDDVVDAEVLGAGKAGGLRVVVKWGVGTDSIDKDAAAELGIPVFNTPGVFADEVADLALAHLLTLARGTQRMHASVLSGGWLQVQGRSLAGLTAGVVGLGAVGSAIARRTRAFGMDVVGYDVRELTSAEQEAASVRQVGLTELYDASDAVLLACALTPENHHLLSGPAFAAMKEGVLVVNVARGALIDQPALVEAIRTGPVAGAGLDVFEVEPLPADDPLREVSDRCSFSAHSGSNTTEAVARINEMTTDILLDALGLEAAEGFTPNRVA
jgi:D-3-phosphoglycerate dehydrogenase / 2-oxoglutarate reductase